MLFLLSLSLSYFLHDVAIFILPITRQDWLFRSTHQLSLLFYNNTTAHRVHDSRPSTAPSQVLAVPHRARANHKFSLLHASSFPSLGLRKLLINKSNHGVVENGRHVLSIFSIFALDKHCLALVTSLCQFP